jgi:DNA repair protein RadA/Sms
MGVLIGGEPGIGKSTLLLQCAWGLAARPMSVLYASGEESSSQIAERAARLGLASDNLHLLTGGALEAILEAATAQRPGALIVDSIQAFASGSLDSPAGSLAQVRECAARLLEFSKPLGLPMLLVGHVTKEGSLAGPKALEHLVDTVIYFEGDGGAEHRLLRAIKNRFGPAGELAVFAMTRRGLQGVDRPSSLFLEQRKSGTPGSVVFSSLEGSLPFLVEIQALVGGGGAGSSRRWSTGFDPARASMLLAVLEKRAGLCLGTLDVYLNVAGGVRLGEPAADLPAAAAIASSLLNRPARSDTIVLGEVGLLGEIRPVRGTVSRLREAHELGFTRCVLPHANLKEIPPALTMESQGVSTLSEAIESLL